MWLTCSMRSMKFGTAPVSGWERRSSARVGVFMELSVTHSEDPCLGSRKRENAVGASNLSCRHGWHTRRPVFSQASRRATARQDNGLTGCTGDSRLSLCCWQAIMFYRALVLGRFPHLGSCAGLGSFSDEGHGRQPKSFRLPIEIGIGEVLPAG